MASELEQVLKLVRYGVEHDLYPKRPYMPVELDAHTGYWPQQNPNDMPQLHPSDEWLEHPKD